MARTLVTTAVIRGQDQLTGMLAQISGRVAAFHKQVQGSIGNAARGTFLGGGTLAAAYGMQQLLNKAEEFNKAVFGVGVAAITEGMDEMGKVNLAKPISDMKLLTDESMRLSEKLRMSPTAIAKIGETLAKAGMQSSMLADTMEATAILSKTDFDTPGEKMAEFMNTLRVIQKPNEGEGFGGFIRRQADMVLAAAAETQLSVGTVMEGMRQFQTIGAGMGLKTEDMLALLMGGARRGFMAIELGTALKSDMVRTMKPTPEGQFAINSLLGGIGKNLSDYSLAGATDPGRALASLNRSIGGVKGKFGEAVRKELYAANKGGYQTSDAFIDRITDMVAKQRGTTDEKSRQQLRNAVTNAITTPQGDFKFVDLLADLVKAGASDAQLASIFEGRQLARNKAFMEMFKLSPEDRAAGRVSEYEQTRQLLQRMKGQGLDTVETLWSSSAFGNMKAMASAWERIMIRLANSPGIQQLVNQLERLANTVEKADPAVIKMGAWAGIIALLAGPALAASRAMLAVAGAGAAFLGWAGRMAASPFVAGAARWTGVLGGLAVAAAPVARAFGIIGVGLTAIHAVQNWDSILSFFQQLGSMPGMQALGESLTRMKDALVPMGDAAVKAYNGMLSLFGVDTTGSLLREAIDGIATGLSKIIDFATLAITKLRELFQMQNAPGHFGGGDAEKGGPSTMEGIIPQRFERSTPFDGQALQEAANRPLMLEGELRVAVDVQAQGAKATAETTGHLRGPANAMPVRKANGSAMGV